MAGSGDAHLRPPGESLLRVENMVVEYRTRKGVVHAVSDVSLDVLEGETVGLVGESGCGKSTTGKAIIQIPRPTSGRVLFEDQDLVQLDDETLRRTRPKLQMIFQDPISSLNPRRRVGDIVGEPLTIWKQGDDAERQERVSQVLESVGLDPQVSRTKRPHEFSGGQCQRICIARALVMDPKMIICDEPVSALDVSVQAQIINLLQDMKARYGLTLVFIAHDLAVVKNISDRVAVMYLGKMCEVGSPDRIYAAPAHPYTDALLRSIPEPDPTQRDRAVLPLAGELPSPLAPPSGCRFRTRCPRAEGICAAEEPTLRQVADGQFVACHFPLVGTAVPDPGGHTAEPAAT